MLFWIEAIVDSPEPCVCPGCNRKVFPIAADIKGTTMMMQFQHTPRLESKGGSEPAEMTVRQVLCRRCWYKQRQRTRT